MKRAGANARKRPEPTIVDNERPRGPLTEDELAAVRRAYSDGCRGEVIIGLRGDERVVTVLVHDTADVPAQSRLLTVRAELRRLGCDGIWRVRRVECGSPEMAIGLPIK